MYCKTKVCLTELPCEAAKKKLDNAYIQAEADYINGKIAEVEHLHITKQHSAAWKSISEISVKSSKSTIKLKGASSDARISNWSKNLRNLLGQESTTHTTHLLPRTQISEPLDIPKKFFSINELITVLKSIQTAKAFVPDNLPAIIRKDLIFYSLPSLVTKILFPGENHKLFLSQKKEISSLQQITEEAFLPIAAKIYNILIPNRPLPFADPLLQ